MIPDVKDFSTKTNDEKLTSVNRRWIEPEVDEQVVGELARQIELPIPFLSVLYNRGLHDAEKIERFLRPRLSDLSDPFRLPNMGVAVTRIWDAIDAGEPIVVFGDYDVDGVSSTALMVAFLSELGAVVMPFLPNRIVDGYGFSEDVVRRCIELCRPRLIVTVDCGTGSAAGVEEARKQCVDVIVTDHHEPSTELASALAMVNPKIGMERDDEARMLAGVGVAFKLCHGLLKEAKRIGREEGNAIDLRMFMDFVALGTIADIVPLIGENRILAQYGLRRLQTPRSVGLKTLIEVVDIGPKVHAHHIGFQIGPRLNAAGRLGNAESALELLLTDDYKRAKQLTLCLNAANSERQDIEARISREAAAEIEKWFDPETHFGLVVARRDWHAGVIGIVASRLMKRFGRPSIVIGIDENGLGKGSCRGIEGFDLVEVLARCSEHLRQYGGHAMAAGLEIEEDNVDDFSQVFNEFACELLSSRDLRSIQRVDAFLNLSEVDAWLFDSVEQMRPFGQSNPAPVFVAKHVRVVRSRIVGKNHLQMTLADGSAQLESIGFNMGHRETPEGLVDVAFQLKKNNYHGQESLRLDLQDFRLSGVE